ncbi:alpha/beta fold hydrolase [Streptomyces ipomoeae]|uniref:Alpha/beta fold hydrolase n=1 Tax=Streptomyces ipomoeae TaxID=103232 RepID=A0AAE8W0I2_9ACTN|nr:alpha/beta fold hydrolase [Streptomyces ipomoeae]
MTPTGNHGRAFLILHGWQNHRPANHWQHWLADRLTDLGHEVAYPQLPEPDDPDLERWLAELDALLGELEGRRVTVICHSLACLLWLHAVARDDVLSTGPVDRVLLIAPPAPEVALRHPEIAEFAPPPLTPAQLSEAATYTRVVGSDDDPYCPQGATTTYAEPLALPADLLPGQAHLNPDSGYGDWPSLLDWCLEPTPTSYEKTPIRSRTQDSRTRDSRAYDSRTRDSRTQDSRTQDSRTQDSRTQDSRTHGSRTHNSR